VTKGGTVWRFTPVFSPDGKKLLFADKANRLRRPRRCERRRNGAGPRDDRRDRQLVVLSGRKVGSLRQGPREPASRHRRDADREAKAGLPRRRDDGGLRAGLLLGRQAPHLPLDTRLQADVQRVRVQLRLRESDRVYAASLSTCVPSLFRRRATKRRGPSRGRPTRRTTRMGRTEEEREEAVDPVRIEPRRLRVEDRRTPRSEGRRRGGTSTSGKRRSSTSGRGRRGGPSSLRPRREERREGPRRSDAATRCRSTARRS